jgi:hypothetical protein
MESKKKSVIELPEGQHWIQLRELAHKVSLACAAENENTPADDLNTVFHGAYLQDEVEKELIALVVSRELKALHPKTRGPHAFPFDGYALHEVLVPVEELRDKVLLPRSIALRVAIAATQPEAVSVSVAVDGSKQYTLKTLEVLAGDAGIGKAFKWHTLKADGLWLRNEQTYWHGAPQERAIAEWHPQRDHHKPALPLPFTVFDFAAFSLAGGGVLFLSMNYDDDDCDIPCEDVLNGLGANAGVEVQLLRQSYALVAEAKTRFDLRKDDVTDKAIADAAKWLLAMNDSRDAKATNVPAAAIQSAIPNELLAHPSGQCKSQTTQTKTPKTFYASTNSKNKKTLRPMPSV